jgi:hypothetical protein
MSKVVEGQLRCWGVASMAGGGSWSLIRSPMGEGNRSYPLDPGMGAPAQGVFRLISADAVAVSLRFLVNDDDR